MPNIGIIGAGISGLTLAWCLRDKGEVTLYEATDRAGGHIRSISKEGFLFEAGPRSLRMRGGETTLFLAQELGLEPIYSKQLDRYLFQKGRLQKVGFPLLLPHLFTFLKELFIPKGDGRDETIYDFANRRYNAKIAEQFFDPLISGIFAGDINQLSLKACLPSLYQMEQQYGSLLKALLFSPRQKKVKAPLFSFKQGMEALTKELAKRLTIHYHKKVVNIGKQEITFSDQTKAFADQIFCTTPLKPQIPLASVAAVHLGYHKLLPLNGFGYLIPRSEREKVLGVVFDSSVFPEQNPGKTVMTVMIGGMRMADFANYSEEQFIALALESLKKQLHISDLPEVVHCSRAQNAIPQYPINYSEIPKREEGCTYLGNYYGGISVNECVSKAFKLSELQN